MQKILQPLLLLPKNNVIFMQIKKSPLSHPSGVKVVKPIITMFQIKNKHVKHSYKRS